MTKTNYRLCFFALLFLVLVPAASLAVSITPAFYRFDYQPYAKVDVPFTIAGADRIEVILEPGDFEGYATIDDADPNGTPRMVIIHIRLPEKLEKPGRNVLYLQAKEMNTGSGAIAVAAVRVPVSTFVPYPGYYAEMTLEAPNINEGEVEEFALIVNNLGTNRLERVYGVIDVFDADGKIKTLTTDTVAMDPGTQTRLAKKMDTKGLKPGIYRAEATLYFDGGNTREAEREFTIGTLYVKVNSYTPEMEQGKLNKFEVDIENMWNALIPNVYGVLSFEGEDIKTASVDLLALGKDKVFGYIDTTNQAFGDHDIKITLHYADKTTVADGKVRIVPEATEQAPEEEKPSGFIELRLTPTTLMIAVIILLVVIDAIWLVSKNRAQSRPEEEPKTKRKKL
jgi:hypothetical protein